MATFFAAVASAASGLPLGPVSRLLGARAVRLMRSKMFSEVCPVFG
jgi:hypothetical protein